MKPGPVSALVPTKTSGAQCIDKLFADETASVGLLRGMETWGGQGHGAGWVDHMSSLFWPHWLFGVGGGGWGG